MLLNIPGMMFTKTTYILLLISLIFCVGCKNSNDEKSVSFTAENQIAYAKGFELYDYDTFKILKITQPWPDATNVTEYVLAKQATNVPDSLSQLTFVQTPVQSIVVTSTTHIPSLVSLAVTESLKAFPGLDFISSPTVRQRIEANQIQEIGSGDGINFELTIDVSPQVVIANGGNDSFTKYQQLSNAGIPVIYNGDWVEYSPLGKAEWIKFFGALYDKDEQAAEVFNEVVDAYKKVKKIAQNTKRKPLVFSGAMYQDVWYAPQGDSWTAQLIKDAGAKYLWENEQGTGSLSMAFEQVLADAQMAEYWIGPAQFTAYSEMSAANIHYKQFDAFQHKNIYTYSAKKGATGGLVFYEEATNRPDLLLKDYVKILHPDLMTAHELYFLSPLTD